MPAASPSAARPAVGAATPANVVPDSATNAASGNAVGLAGAADTTTQNSQISAGIAAGGRGSLAVDNQHSSTVLDSSAASASSGVSVALVPTPVAGTATGTGPATGVTTAHSGDTTAVGITTSNNVANTALQAVTVNGANQAPVSLSSNANVIVQDTGAAGASSGAAWAVAPGVPVAPSGVATPNVVGAAPASVPMSATGLQAQTNVTSVANATVTVAGGPASTAAISIVSTPVAATIVNGGIASASSGAACSGPACPAQAAAAAGGATQAASGAAMAQGLIAQNNVTTNANVAVKIAGQNYAPIKVVVDSLTQIFNWGVASSTSGDATAGGNSSAGGASGAGASSGSAQATGAQVQNTVNLRSSAAVKVNGDNYNPINIFLNLATNVMNWGAGFSSSGDAQANGNGGGTASSGSSSATGLQAMNLVSMWADASVDVEGNNYAPIDIEIHFKTNIDNLGYASATSGNVAAGKAGASSSSSASATATKTSSTGGSSTSAGSSSKAHGGDAIAVSNSVVGSVSSDQISSANGSHSILSPDMASLVRTLPSGSWNPLAPNSNLPNPAPSALVDGAASNGGNATAVGLQSAITQQNSQIAACSDPGVSCFAGNTANLSSTMRDLPRNPATVDSNGNQGPGGTNAVSQFTGVNATPTPTPAPLPAAQADASNGSDDGQGQGDGSDGNGRNSSSGHASSSRTTQVSSRTVATGLPANGHLVLVDLWDQWPGRRLPPMPNQLKQTPPASAYVSASLDTWPGADELPLPEPGVASDDTPQAASAAVAVSRRSLPVASASTDVSVQSEDEDDTPLLAIQDVDPLGGWPGVEALPMPAQALAAPVVAGTQTDSQDATALPPELGVTPVDFGGVLAIASAAVAALGGLSRGRGLVAMLLMWLAAPFSMRGRGLSGLWLGQQTARGLALLRLTLGILRLW